MLWILYIFLFIVAGILIWRKIFPQREILESLLFGSLLGMILGSFIPFFFGLVFSFAQAALFSLVSALLIVLIFIYFDWENLIKIKKEFYQLRELPKRKIYSFCILFFAFLVIFIPSLFFVSRIFFVNPEGGYNTGFVSAYGDVPFHLMYITSFAFGDNFLPQNPDYAGTLSNYPFIPYIVSASLIKLGAGLRVAFLAPAFILSFLIISILIFISWRITKNVWAAILAPILFIFSGGLGFWWFFRVNGINIFSSGNKLGEIIVNQPTNIPDIGINLMNVMYASLLPQRGILFGLSIFLVIIFLWFLRTKKTIIVSAFLMGSLPLLHPHTFIALILVLLPILVVSVIKKSHLRAWIWFFIIVFFAVLPVIIFLRPDIDSNFIRFTSGWMRGEDNFIWYWLKNLGFFLPVLLFAFFSKKVPKYLKLYYLYFLPLFIVPNFIIFSPWEFDNHKFFYLWYLVSAFLIAFYLIKLFEEKDLFLKITAVFLFFLLIISGVVEVARLWHFSEKGYALFDSEAQELAEFLKNNTPPNSVFISSTSHLSPVILSGRKRFLGYKGWVWAHGIDYSQRDKEDNLIYSGNENAKELMQEQGINYILIGRQEMDEFSVDLSYFEKNFKRIYNKNNYQVFLRE